MSARARKISVDGVRLHVRDVGEGAPVLLINGIGAHVDMWGPLERSLEGLRIISFDAPGTGRSQAPLTPRTMPALACMVEQLLDQLELARVDVLGYSFGGAVAQELAVRAPERVRRLVLAATFPGWGGVPGDLAALLLLMTPLRYQSELAYRLSAGIVAGGRARRDPAYVRDRWKERGTHPPALRGYTFQLWAVTAWSSLRRLRTIEAPTLVVLGDDDPVVPLANALLMGSRIPQSRVVVGRDEGHFLLLDDDSDVLPQIRSFLEASNVDDALVWRQALAPTAADVAAQLERDGLGALPWGLWSAAYRRLAG